MILPQCRLFGKYITSIQRVGFYSGVVISLRKIKGSTWTTPHSVSLPTTKTVNSWKVCKAWYYIFQINNGCRTCHCMLYLSRHPSQICPSRGVVWQGQTLVLSEMSLDREAATEGQGERSGEGNLPEMWRLWSGFLFGSRKCTLLVLPGLPILPLQAVLTVARIQKKLFCNCKFYNRLLYVMSFTIKYRLVDSDNG